MKGPLDGVALLTFARHPISLSETMFWLHAASFPTMNGRPRWANGAAVFVEGLSRGLMAAAGVEHLCARHVIVGRVAVPQACWASLVPVCLLVQAAWLAGSKTYD